MIEVKGITKEIENGSEKLIILNNVNLKINDSEFVAICGKSGCGKSTLMAIMSGIDVPTKGSVYVNDTDIYALSNKSLTQFRNENFGIIFQNFNLISNLTAKENVEIPQLLALKENKTKRSAIQMLNIVGLNYKASVKAANLSGGEQQRVAIARALIQEPKIIFADEPTGSLDYANSIIILDLFEQIRKELDVAIVLVTHDDYVAKKADRILELDYGNLYDAAVAGAGPTDLTAPYEEFEKF